MQLKRPIGSIPHRAQLLAGRRENDHRPLFALKVVENLVMPDELCIGITGLTSNVEGAASIGDFGEARVYIMKQLARTPQHAKVQRAKSECWEHWFIQNTRTFRMFGTA